MKKKKMSASADKKEDKKEGGGIIDYLSKHFQIGGKHIGGQGRAKDIQDAVDKAVNPQEPKDMQEDTETALKDLRKKRTAKR